MNDRRTALARPRFRRVEDNSLQAFYKRFSGLVRALPPEPAGADAWRATTYGHGILQTNPLGSALDQESRRVTSVQASSCHGADDDRRDRREPLGRPTV